jgi:hypothetical protein
VAITRIFATYCNQLAHRHVFFGLFANSWTARCNTFFLGSMERIHAIGEPTLCVVQIRRQYLTPFAPTMDVCYDVSLPLTFLNGAGRQYNKRDARKSGTAHRCLRKTTCMAPNHTSQTSGLHRQSFSRDYVPKARGLICSSK